jgi:hypothetical protein
MLIPAKRRIAGTSISAFQGTTFSISAKKRSRRVRFLAVACS